MSEEIKPTDSASSDSTAPVGGSAEQDYFSNLVSDYSADQSDGNSQEETIVMKNFSEFFNDAAASGEGFESTIDSTIDRDELSEEVAKPIRFTEPVTDENGMIVIFDEEAGIDAVDSAGEVIAAMRNSEQGSADEQDSNVLREDMDAADAGGSDIVSDSENAVLSDDGAVEFRDEPDESPIDEEDAELIDSFKDLAFDKSQVLVSTDVPADDDEIKTPEHFSESDGSDSAGFLASFFPHKGDSIPEILRKCVFIVALIVFIAAAFMLISTLVQSREAVIEQDEIMSVYESIVSTTVETTVNEEGVVVTVAPSETQSHEERVEANFDIIEYYQKYSEDYVGFLEVSGCNIMYPVVQGDDNEYYLTHTYTGRQNKAGSLFLDYRCTITEEEVSPNLVIYGHNQEDGTMFGKLKLYKDNCSFYKYNPFVTFSTLYDVNDYVIFAYFVTNATAENDINGEVFHYHDYIDALSDEATFNWYMEEVYERNQIISPVDVEYGDELLVLSTCSSDFSEARFVVFARKIRDGENKYRFDFSSTVMNPDAKITDMDEAISQSVSVSESISVSESESEAATETSVNIITIIPEMYNPNDTITTETTTVTETTTTTAATAATGTGSSLSLATTVNAEESRAAAEQSRAQSIKESLAANPKSNDDVTTTQTTESVMEVPADAGDTEDNE